MRSRRNRGRRAATASLGAGLAGAVVVAALGGGTAGASGAGGPLRDGNWTGTLAVGATIDFSQSGVGIIASGQGNGSFDLLLAGGLAGGSFALGASSTATVESSGATGEANAVIGVTGEMQGNASGPILAPLVGHADVTGTVDASGVAVPFEVALDFAPEDMTASTMIITASSCGIASGTWAQEFRTAVEAAGGSISSFQGSWAATFSGADPGVTNAVLEDLLATGEAILLQWFENGTFDVTALEQVLIDAEHFAASGPTNDGCGNGTPGAWASPLAGLVQRLLTAVANSPSTTPEILRFGVAAGLRTNTLPSIAPDTLEASLLTKATELLDAAIAANDQAGIWFLLVTADSMGWTDLAATATNAMGS